MIRFTAIMILTASGFFLFAQSFDQVNAQIEESMSETRWNEAAEKITYCLNAFDLDPLAQANLNHNLGLCKLQVEDFLNAQKALHAALELKLLHYNGKNSDYAKTAQLLGDMYLQVGDYDRSRDYLTEGQQLIQKNEGEMTDLNVDALINLGQFYEAVGGFQTAHTYFDKALTISKQIHHRESPEYAEVLNHIGRIYIQNGELDLAETNLITSNTIYKELGSAYKLQYIESQENLAMLYEREGKYAEAEKLLLTIEQQKRAMPNIPEELLLETLNDLGILYMDLNNFNKAKQYFTEVKQVSEKHLGSEHNFFATAINNLAAIAKRQRNYDEAKILLSQAIDIYKRIYGPKHPQYANALNNLASVERLLGNFETSEVYYKEVMEVDKVIYGERHPNYATTMNNMGILYSSMGKLSTAGLYYQQAVDIRKESLGVNHPSYARSVENLGIHYFILNDLVQSEKNLREAVDIKINQISTIFPALTEQERELFYDEIREDIERYIYVAYQLLDTKPELIQNILNYQIATKGLLFSSTERIRNAIASSNDQRLIDQYLKWAESKVRLAGYYQLGNLRLEQYGINLEEEEAAIENLEKNLMLQSEIFSGLFKLDQTKWEDIRDNLQAKEALVEIVRFREFNSQASESSGYLGFTDKVHYLYIVIKPDSRLPVFVSVDNGAALETKGFSLYNNSVKYESELRSSFINYWEAIHNNLKGSNHVMVSPDGVYFKMNPNVFNTGENEYIIDSYYVTYVTNCKDILKDKGQLPGKPTATLIGNPKFGENDGSYYFNLKPLPGAQKEVDQLAGLMQSEGWNIQKYTQQNAVELSLKQSSNNPTVLHIATHGYFDGKDPVIGNTSFGDNPMFKSGLYFTDAVLSYGQYLNGKALNPANDGILTSYEAMNLDLSDTRLVVLSACETALGDIELGEGVYGLQRAIMTAGASNLITSMTKVEDEATQELMTAFYRNFLKSDNVIESFRDAQAELRKTYTDPRIWGAFLLTGNG